MKKTQKNMPAKEKVSKVKASKTQSTKSSVADKVTKKKNSKPEKKATKESVEKGEKTPKVRKVSAVANPSEKKLIPKWKQMIRFYQNDPETLPDILNMVKILAKTKGVPTSTITFKPHEIRFKTAAIYHMVKFILMCLNSMCDRIRDIPSKLKGGETLNIKHVLTGVYSTYNAPIEELQLIETEIKAAWNRYQSLKGRGEKKKAVSK